MGHSLTHPRFRGTLSVTLAGHFGPKVLGTRWPFTGVSRAETPKKSEKSLPGPFRDFFGTFSRLFPDSRETFSRLFPDFRGGLGPEGPGDFFQTFSGSRPERPL